MQFSTLLATAFALAIAEAKIAFTQVPGASVTVGVPFTIEWDGAEPDSSVTITLKQGDPNDLTTVALLTGNGSGNSFTWTPSSSLPDGDDYALEISQGTGFDTTNYSGEFSITGGSSSASASASATGGSGGSGSSPSSATITMTSGNSTFVTSYSMYPAATGTGAASTTGRNGTFTHTTKAAASTGGIIVTATSTVAETTTAGQTSPSASSSGAAAHAGPLTGAAAALLGLAALL